MRHRLPFFPVWFAALGVSAALLASGCGPGTAGAGTGFPIKMAAVPPEDGPARPDTAAGEADGESYREFPKIALYPGEKLVQVLTTSLDADEIEEQVIIVRQESGAAPLKLIIADASGDGGWARSYESEIGATDDRTVRIDVADIIGNSSLQIVVSGMNAATQATLDAFRVVSPPGGRLAYFPICRLVSDGTIEIDESGSAGYSGGHRYGASFPIIAYHGDPRSAVATDVIRETYAYHHGAQAYVLQKRENVAAPAADDRLAAVLKNSTAESLRSFIKGLWRKTDEAVRSDEKILSFDPESDDIAFYSNDVQELYKWRFSRRSLYNTLQIYTESALLKSVQPNITVVLVSPNELSVSVTEYSTMEQWLNEQWGGIYVRLPDGRPAAGEQPAAPVIDGEYVSPEGARIAFSSARFTWHDGKKPRSGGYTIMEFRTRDSLRHVLSLKIIEDQGLTVTDRFYIIETTDVPKPNVPLSSFTLLPARTSVYGIVDAKGQPLPFTRRPG